MITVTAKLPPVLALIKCPGDSIVGVGRGRITPTPTTSGSSRFWLESSSRPTACNARRRMLKAPVPLCVRQRPPSSAPGTYASAGEQISIVDSSIWFVLANFREADLPRIRPGQSVSVYLMAQRGKVVCGIVQGIPRAQGNFSAASFQRSQAAWAGLPSSRWLRMNNGFPGLCFSLSLAG